MHKTATIGTGEVTANPSRQLSKDRASHLDALARRVCDMQAPVVLIDALPGTGKSLLLNMLSRRLGMAVTLDGAQQPGSPASSDPPPIRLIDLPPEAHFSVDEAHGRVIVAGAAEQIAGHARLRLYGQLAEFSNIDLFLCASVDPRFSDSAGWPALSAHFAAKPTDRATALAFLRETVMPRLNGTRVQVLQALTRSRRGLRDAGIGAEARAALLWLRPLVSLTQDGVWALQGEGFVSLMRDVLQDMPYSPALRQLLEDSGDTVAAVRSALAAGHRQRAIGIMEAAGGVMLGHLQGPEEARAVLAAFGDDPHPSVAALRIMSAMKAGHAGQAARMLDSAIRALPDPQRTADVSRPTELPVTLRLIRLLMAIYSDRALDAAFQSEYTALLAEVPPDNHLLRGAVYNVALDEQIRAGRQGEAQATASRALAHYREAGAPYLAFYIHVHMALMRLVAGAPDLAAAELDGAEDELAATGFDTPQDERFLRLLRAQVAYEQGRPEAMAAFAESAFDGFAYGELWPTIAAQALAFGAESLLLLKGTPAALAYLEGWRVQMWRTRRFRLLIEQREVLILQSARRWREARLKLDAMATRIGRIWMRSAGENLADLNHPEDLGQALIWLRQFTLERPRDRALGELLAQAAYNPNLSWRQRRCLDIWRAWAARRRGQVAQARRHLADTLGACDARRCLAPLLEERLLVLPMLVDPRLQGGAMTAAPVPAVLRGGLVGEAGAGPLSRQEFRALLLLAESCSNKEIAREMAISLPTVKFHLKNLYAKLGAKDRRAALAIARQRRILEG